LHNTYPQQNVESAILVYFVFVVIVIVNKTTLNNNLRYNYIQEMATGELEFEAPLARFDVEEWTEYHENTSDEEENFDCHRNLPDNNSLSANHASISAENESTSDSSNVTENFSETCSGSLEDLVNSFDQRVTKCCRNYEEQVERLAPVQVRSQEDAHDSYQ